MEKSFLGTLKLRVRPKTTKKYIKKPLISFKIEGKAYIKERGQESNRTWLALLIRIPVFILKVVCLFCVFSRTNKLWRMSILQIPYTFAHIIVLYIIERGLLIVLFVFFSKGWGHGGVPSSSIRSSRTCPTRNSFCKFSPVWEQNTWSGLRWKRVYRPGWQLLCSPVSNTSETCK